MGANNLRVVYKWDGRAIYLGTQCSYLLPLYHISLACGCSWRSRAQIWAKGLSRWKIPGAKIHLHFPKDTEQVHLANDCTLPINPMNSYNLSVLLRHLGSEWVSPTGGWFKTSCIFIAILVLPSLLSILSTHSLTYFIYVQHIFRVAFFPWLLIETPYLLLLFSTEKHWRFLNRREVLIMQVLCSLL